LRAGDSGEIPQRPGSVIGAVQGLRAGQKVRAIVQLVLNDLRRQRHLKTAGRGRSIQEIDVRVAIVQQLPDADKKQLPEVTETADALYERASDLARTLNEMDQSFGAGSHERIRMQLDALALRPDSEERNRQLSILERQVKTATDLAARRDAFVQRFESSELAMRNLRLDLIKLRTGGIGALNDVTSATQQARAIPRDVENLTAAASEIREAMG